VTVRVVAEFGQSCRGNLDVAMRQAKAAKDAGAWAGKWQIFQPERLVSIAAARYWDPNLGGHKSQMDTFAANGMLADKDWAELAAYCRGIGLVFACSPFDLEAVDTLVEAGVDVIKLASGEITHRAMVRKVAATGKEVVLSVGASTRDEIQRALDWLDGCKVTLLACSLAYPTADADANLARIEALGGFRSVGVGFSDHTTRVETALAAATLGAVMLEKHCRLHVGSGVPDDKMALDPERLAEYVRLAELGATLLGSPALGASEAELPALVGARRSLHAAKTMRGGHVLKAGDLVALRPGDGISPADEPLFLNRPLKRSVRSGAKLVAEDVG
jgi:N,N'-diacetyllegionaminate synthase